MTGRLLAVAQELMSARERAGLAEARAQPNAVPQPVGGAAWLLTSPVLARSAAPSTGPPWPLSRAAAWVAAQLLCITCTQRPASAPAHTSVQRPVSRSLHLALPLPAARPAARARCRAAWRRLWSSWSCTATCWTTGWCRALTPRWAARTCPPWLPARASWRSSGWGAGGQGVGGADWGVAGWSRLGALGPGGGRPLDVAPGAARDARRRSPSGPHPARSKGLGRDLQRTTGPACPAVHLASPSLLTPGGCVHAHT